MGNSQPSKPMSNSQLTKPIYSIQMEYRSDCNSHPTQTTWNMCMMCHRTYPYEKVNANLSVLQISNYSIYSSILLRCDKNHLFYYCGDHRKIDTINNIINKEQKNTSNKILQEQVQTDTLEILTSENLELKKEILKLKTELNELANLAKNNVSVSASAPPLPSVPYETEPILVEATLLNQK